MTFTKPERFRTISQPRKFGTEVPMFNAGRVSTLLEQINNGLPSRMQQRLNIIQGRDNNYAPVGPLDPWDFPPYYDDPEANTELTTFIRQDAEPAVDLAIRWKLFGNPKDAQAVERIIWPWTTIKSITNNGDNRLTWSNKFPMFIQAAMLIEDSPVMSTALRRAMEDILTRNLDRSTAFIQTQNRAAWGLVYNLATAAYIKDRQLFDISIARWRELFNNDIRDNAPYGELERGSDSLHYVNFWMDAMTQAAEIARFNGEWLYDHKTPDGSTYKGVWEKTVGWTANPETFTAWPGSSTIRIRNHVDPLHALWPNADSQKLINTYTTTQDYNGFRHSILAYRNRPLYG